MKVRTVMYVHGEKEQATADFEEACEKAGVKPHPEAWHKARWACHEVAVQVEFDSETGESEIIGLVEE